MSLTSDPIYVGFSCDACGQRFAEGEGLGALALDAHQLATGHEGWRGHYAEGQHPYERAVDRFDALAAEGMPEWAAAHAVYESMPTPSSLQSQHDRLVMSGAFDHREALCSLMADELGSPETDS